MKQIYLIVFFLLTLMVFGCSPSEPESDSAENHVAEYTQKFPFQDAFNYAMGYTSGHPTKLNTWAIGGRAIDSATPSKFLIHLNS